MSNTPTNFTLDLVKDELLPLQKISVHTGWDISTGAVSNDLDLSAFVLTNGVVAQQEDVCYFKNPTIRNGSVVAIYGDNRTGSGVGDDEVINVNLAALDSDVTDVIFVLNVYDAKSKNQTFNNVDNAYISAYNSEDNQLLSRVDIVQNDSDHIVFARVRRVNDSWVFVNISEYGNGDLNAIADNFK